MPRSGIAGSYSSSIFNFLSSLHTVLHGSCTNFIPISSAQMLPSLHILTNSFHLIFFMIVILTRYTISWKWKVKGAQLCPTLCMDCTVCRILQVRILEWVAIPFSMGSSQPRDWTQASHAAGGFFTSWATREAPLYGSGNSAQCYMAAWRRQKPGGEWIHVCVWLSPFAVHLKLSQRC